MGRPKSSAMDTGHYRCKVTDEKGISIFTQLVNVSLAYQEDTNDDAKRSMKQFEQLKGACYNAYIRHNSL